MTRRPPGTEAGLAPAVDSTLPLHAFFFFQLSFAVTAATIVSGAVAERIKIQAFMAFAVILTALVYPINGHWVWGGGWLSRAGFADFAGSTVVHSVGGWAALVGAVLLGPRLGQVRQQQQDAAHRRPQHVVRDPGRPHPVAGLVRV